MSLGYEAIQERTSSIHYQPDSQLNESISLYDALDHKYSIPSDRKEQRKNSF
jgi:hypothetical protein